MESKTPGYRSLPFIFSIVLIFVSYLLNNWYQLAREIVSTEFDVTVYAAYAVIAPLIFALLCLLLFATVFNQRLTTSGSIVLAHFRHPGGLTACLAVFHQTGIYYAQCDLHTLFAALRCNSGRVRLCRVDLKAKKRETSRDWRLIYPLPALNPLTALP